MTEISRPVRQVYIIDDDPQTCSLLTAFCEHLSIQAHSVNAWQDVELETLKSSDLLLLDLNLPNVDGLDILDILKANNVDTPILICSGEEEAVISVASDLVRAGQLSYVGQLQKPFNLAVFEQTLQAFSPVPVTAGQSRAPKQPVPMTPTELDEAVAEFVEKQAFTLVFQPQITVEGRTIVGVECLSRMVHPDWGMISPDKFIPSIDKQGLMDQFTLQVIRSGLNTLGNLSFASQLTISFNLSTTSLTEQFVEQLDQLVPSDVWQPAQLVLEITETAALDIKSIEPIKVLTKLRMRGYGLSLDDFGTGYSTIQELNHLPVNEIKVDKSFVQTMNTRKTSDAIVSTTIELANKLDYRVVAEGVETEEQAAKLQQLQCLHMQGFLFAPPLSIEQLEAYWAEQQADG